MNRNAKLKLNQLDQIDQNELLAKSSSIEKGKFPQWLKVKAPAGEKFLEIKQLMKTLKLSTVCEEALCPNIEECWNGGTATIMLMGDTCTRACKFCGVKTGNPKGILDIEEISHVVTAVSSMNLKYIVLTSVNRDDLPDEGAQHFADVVMGLRKNKPQLIVEVLVPDFSNRDECIETILNAKPHVYGHNVETVERLTPKMRDRRATYSQSLSVLEKVKSFAPTMWTKSAIQVGVGETFAEVEQTLKDLRNVGCSIVTIGQYLSPSVKHAPVVRHVRPEEFLEWENSAKKLGFDFVASGPLVRSSYRAGELFIEGKISQKLFEV